jgi:3-deoxy-D-manno-octulosonic-acid transferase
MPLLLDALYLLALAVLSPWLVWRAIATGRYRRDLAAKLLGRVRVPNTDRKPVAWFHGVSVGEIHLLATVVAAFRKRHPDWLIVVSSTTDTGLDEARKRFADLPVIAYPFDFSWAAAAALDAVRPSLVVLAEGEMWPNFLHAASRRNIPVAVVNARMSPRSFARLRRLSGPARRLMFRHVDAFAVQSPDYADRLRQLGVDAGKLTVTGSVKYDGATGDRDTPKARELRRALGLAIEEPAATKQTQPAGGVSPPSEIDAPDASSLTRGANAPRSLVWVAGSTHAPEESIVLDVFAKLRPRFPHLRLILVPRHPDRFAEVAQLVERSGLPFARRSRVTAPLAEMPEVVLLDTVGELGAAWGLADVGYTGGSLDGQRGGQSMIEPAGYGVPTLFGPHVWNFRDAAGRLLDAGGAVMVQDAAELERELAKLLEDAGLRERMGESARKLVREQQGATERTLDVLDRVIGA